jgi:tetratricopeptide (TPR) repeat protein
LEGLVRPVARFSLAVNWYFAKNDVTAYHAVNISIHFITSFFLFLTILQIFETPRLKGNYQGSEYFIALLTAALWASHPIQTQAVTYIVQRMASLAGMFCVIGIFLFLKARSSNNRAESIVLYFSCLGSYLLAMGSKENAVILPAFLLLIEVLFFQDLRTSKSRKKLFAVMILAGLGLALAAGTILFFRGKLFSFLELYEHRSFTLAERLLTEPRILIFYLSQIFYPIVNRLSISHDITISTSLWSPWTSLFGILFVCLLIGIGITQVKKRPIIALAILFFFLGHVVESTIIPLELIFEHRNYLPSIFLFLPIAVGLKKLLDYYQKEMRPMFLVVVSFVILLIVGLGSGTYIRNLTWLTERSLWEDAIEKAPGRARAYQNLANSYYEKIGSQDTAIKLYEKALSLRDDNKWRPERVSYLNMGRIYTYQKKEHNKAIGYFQKLLDIEQYEQYAMARYDMVMAMIAEGRFEEASRNADFLLAINDNNIDNLNTKGFISLKQNEPGKTLKYFDKALRIDVDNRKTLINGSIALNMLGRYDSADHFLNSAKRLYPNDIVVMFAMIENNVELGKTVEAKQNAEEMIARFSIERIMNGLDKLSSDNSMWPISQQLIIPAIEEALKRKSKEIAILGSTAGESTGSDKPNQ